MSRRIVVIAAGLGQPSSTRLLADQLVAAVRTQLTARGDSADVEVIEVRELATELAASLTSGVVSPRVAAAREAVSGADALIAVTPVFASSYAGLFKLFIDALDPDALSGMPVLIAATAGTPRHALVLDYALRPLFTYFRSVVVPTGVFAATEDIGGGGGALAARVRRAAGELAELVAGRSATLAGFVERETERPERPARRSGNEVDDDVTPFAELLKGHTGRPG